MTYTEGHLGWIGTAISAATSVFSSWNKKDQANQEKLERQANESLEAYNARVQAAIDEKAAAAAALTNEKNRKTTAIVAVVAGAVIIGAVLGKRK